MNLAEKIVSFSKQDNSSGCTIRIMANYTEYPELVDYVTNKGTVSFRNSMTSDEAKKSIQTYGSILKFNITNSKSIFYYIIIDSALCHYVEVPEHEFILLLNIYLNKLSEKCIKIDEKQLKDVKHLDKYLTKKIKK